MKILLLYCFILSSLLSYCQEDISCEDKVLYELGQRLNELTYETNLMGNSLFGKEDVKAAANETIKQIHLKALDAYTIIVTKYTNSPFYNEAMFEKGEIEFWYISKAKATDSYLTVLASDSGNLLKNKSSIRLAAIAIEAKEFEKALTYLEKSKTYKKMYTCGNEYENDMLTLQRMYDQCYSALQKQCKR